MNNFIVTSTVFSQATTGASYHISEREAHIAATGRVNWLRADIDPESLSPVDIGNWRLALVEAQLRQQELLGINVSDVDHSTLADTTGLNVRIEEFEAHGLSALSVDDRELATVLAALRGHQRRTCPPDLLPTATNDGRYVPLTDDEIDALCERLNCGVPPPQDVNVVVELDGGLVEGIVADRPIKVRVVDYDVEGADPDGLVLVPQDKGASIPAAASGWGVDSICVDAQWIDRLDAAIASEN